MKYTGSANSKNNRTCKNDFPAKTCFILSSSISFIHFLLLNAFGNMAFPEYKFSTSKEIFDACDFYIYMLCAQCRLYFINLFIT